MNANPPTDKNTQRAVLQRVGLYIIEEEISRGASAIIYRAVNVTFQYKVALKVLHPALKDDEAIVRYFIAEGQDSTRLIHPNIVRIYDAGLSDGQACIAQAYVDGLTLTQLMRSRSRPFSINETLRVLDEIGNALEFTHAQGWIHGNLKPTNIFRNQSGQFLLSDFRVASPVAILRPTNYPLGRTAYLSPEQRQGTVMLTPMSDVFSLALIAFEMLTGQLPYGVDDSSIVAPYIHGGMLANVQVEDPQIRNDIALILSRALAADPAQRYPSVEGFIQALTGAAQNRLDTLRLSDPIPSAPQPTTTALALYRAAPLAIVTPQSRALMVLPKATKQEQQDMSWISFVVGSILIAMLVLGVFNTINLMTHTPTPAVKPDPQVLNTIFYTLFARVASLLEQAQIMRFFSPVYGLAAAVVLLVLLFQRELLRTLGIGAENRYWKFLGYAIPPTTVAFLLLLVLQIFRMVQAT